MNREIEYALPAVLYGDPAEKLDEIRARAKAAEKRARQDRLHKGRRIRALVKKVMREGGGR